MDLDKSNDEEMEIDECYLTKGRVCFNFLW